jgi:hypothetical protein
MIMRVMMHVRVLLKTRIMVTNGHGVLSGKLGQV